MALFRSSEISRRGGAPYAPYVNVQQHRAASVYSVYTRSQMYTVALCISICVGTMKMSESYVIYVCPTTLQSGGVRMPWVYIAFLSFPDILARAARKTRGRSIIEAGMSAQQQLQEEVERLKEHLRQIQECTPEQCALEFRQYVASAREPFHANHGEANAWTMDKKGGGCCIIS